VFVGATENFPGNAGPIGWVFAFPTDCGTDGSVCHPRWIGRSRDELTGVVPEVFDGRLLVTSILGGFVDAFDADCAPTGRRCARAWSTGFSIAPQLPVGADGVVYVAEGNGGLSAFDVSCQGEACKRLWTWTDPKAAELSPPTIVGDNVFVSTSDGRLLAFSLGAGRRPRAGATLPLLYVAVLLGVLAAVAGGRRLSRRSSVRSSSERP
jgi:outer membrane protein assembly factor BamB